MLVRAKHCLPKTINAHLWPFALCMANDVHMHTPQTNGKAPLDLLSQVASTLIPQHFHPFGCPVNVLSDDQSGGKGSKWDERARVGINLGHAPSHARSITLVLNTNTGLVLPQFHVKFEDLLKMVSSMNLQVKWSKRTGFTKSDEPAPTTEPPIPDTYQLPPQTMTPIMEQPTQETQPQPHPETLVPTTKSATPSEGATSNEGDTSIPTQSRRRVTFDLPSVDDATTAN
jgi:hypothetical protein